MDFDDICLQRPWDELNLGAATTFAVHPRLSLTAEFLSNFDRFNLNAQEGYLVSLIDGRMDVQKLMILSSFDQFTTIFILAKLEHERAITVPT